MLQRAASNAYSWWWAGHVRTKQTKWLEQSLQDVEENVQNMLKIIEQEGDSFAKRAEMYYKKRPELINLVEENFRAYRALADRFDHLSTELQNANTTIASVFPERAEMAMDDDDDEDAPPRTFDNLSQYSSENVPKPPAYPPMSDIKGFLKSATKELKKGSSPDINNREVYKSGLTKPEAFEEIDKLQKEILALQTVKEFVKSSYENGIAKYSEIESRLAELQERVFSLQDEFCVEQVIEDDEARTLMVEAALQSCDEALSQLQEKQRKSTDEAREEFQKVENAREKLKFLREKFLPDEDRDEATKASRSQQRATYEESQQEFDELREKIKAHFNEGSRGSLTVTEMVEKIDELVNKVISLETAVSSQTAIIDRMKTDSEELQTQIHTLEDEKATLIDGTDVLKNKLTSLEDEVNRLQELNKKFQNENNHLRACFTEARCSLDHLSEKLHSVKTDEDLESMELSHEEDYSSSYGLKTPERSEKHFDFRRVGEGSLNGKQEDMKSSYKLDNTMRSRNYGSVDNDSIFMNEYNGLIKNLKDAKKKIGDLERTNQEILFEKTAEITDLRSTVAKRDVTIRCLLQKLKLLQENFDENEDFQEENRENNLQMILMDQPQYVPPIEDKLRMNIDSLLDDNLNFWFKFSTSFQQIHKFKLAFDDLQGDILRVKEKEKGSGIADIKSDLRPIYKHLREIETEITIWVKHSSLLKDELQNRYSILCKIEDDITKALKVRPDDENEKNFSAHEAAKFQGELANMKQECYKVRNELHAGLDHVANLKQEIEKTFTKLDEDFEAKVQNNNNNNNNYYNNDQAQFKSSKSRARVPLRTFIFGAKPKKKMSLFSLLNSRKKNEFKGCGL